MKIFIKQRQSPGDILMLTAAIRDLKREHPYLKVNVQTPCMELWQNNPLLSRDVTSENADRVIDLQYPLIHSSDRLPYHFIHAFRKELQLHLGLSIRQGGFKGDIYMTESEKRPLPDLGGKKYWVLDAGYKLDCPLKHWGSENFQKLVDILSGKVQFVQIGERNPKHIHTPLRGVIDFVGKTTTRELMTLIYNSCGVVTPISFPMHLAAAVPTADNSLRPCVVLAGGREPAHWEAYPGHQFLHTVGMLDCCSRKACWQSQISGTDGTGGCLHPAMNGNEIVGKCMTLISPERVAELILMYNGSRPTPADRKNKKA
jgi:ADP-heptose:LPS heptosyltransferase